ncbi:MAG: hypothetical protein HY288_02240 [Planctomycetia bacterium]|nr:hypothetical protein [Planctomycetia bacterium]
MGQFAWNAHSISLLGIKKSMSKLGTYQALNRLLTILYRSLPMYLTYAHPWTHRGEEKALTNLRHIADDQKQMAGRIARHILDHHGPIETGEYPIDFLDMHDLSLDFLITRLVQCQKNDVAAIEQCVAELRADRQAGVLAEEALGAARGQLEALEELAEQFANPAS